MDSEFLTAHALIADPILTLSEYEPAGGFVGLRWAFEAGADETLDDLGDPRLARTMTASKGLL